VTTTRRRGSELEEAILDAGWDQLIDQGYPGFTFEAVAERAQTGKAVIYRRWPDKEALLLAVLAHRDVGTPLDVPDKGSLREDVIALLRAANRYGDSVTALLSAILGAYFDDTGTTPARLRARLLGDRSVAMTRIVERAIERGELKNEPPPRVLALPGDLMRNEAIMNLGKVPDSTIVDIVDTVFLPLATLVRKRVPGKRP
jgi:AcrR family transcriptional regulator